MDKHEYSQQYYTYPDSPLYCKNDKTVFCEDSKCNDAITYSKVKNKCIDCQVWRWRFVVANECVVCEWFDNAAEADLANKNCIKQSTDKALRATRLVNFDQGMIHKAEHMRSKCKNSGTKRSINEYFKTPPVVKKCKKASSGLKSLIAARRKAAKLVTEEPALSSQSQKSEKTTWRNNTDPAHLEPADDKTFDGGFFTVKSPMSERKSPRSCKSSSNKLRHTAVTNSAKKVSSFLLSPFISAMAKMSLSSSASPKSCSTTSVVAASPSKPPKPIILFKDTAEDEEVTAEEVVIVEEIINID